MRSAFVSALFLAAVAAQAAPFTGSVLGLDNDNIYSIDLQTGAASSVASLTGHGTGDTNALAFDSATNTAYFQRNDFLWSVNLTSGTFTKTTAQIGGVADATYYNGAYYYATSSAVMKVDLATKAISTFGTYNKGWGFGDIATKGSTMYGVSGSSLFSIDMTNAAYSLISNSAKQTQLAFVGGDLYGVATGNAGDPAGTIYSIDTATGAFVAGANRAHIGNTFLQIRDAATLNPVPEPASIAALGIGALGILRRRRQR